MTSVSKSQESSLSKNHKINSPKYGVYVVKDRLELELPQNSITLERISDDKFSYHREGNSGTIEKLISIRTPNLEMEFVPTLPIYTPSYKTDYMFLRLAKPIFVSKDSTTEVFFSIPVEMGLFFTGSAIREPFDVFSCDPDSSRYALYGQPENGKLCKYAISLPKEKEVIASPYLQGQIKIIIKNELETGITIGKIVFPIRDHDVYYEKSKAAFDNLQIEIRERLGVEIADMTQLNDSGPKEWKKSPRTMKITDLKFSMVEGLA